MEQLGIRLVFGLLGPVLVLAGVFAVSRAWLPFWYGATSQSARLVLVFILLLASTSVAIFVALFVVLLVNVPMA